MERIAELERHASNKEQEAARHGKNLSTAEKELSAYKERDRLAQEAALSEAQKLEKRSAELEQQAAQYKTKLISAQVKLAAQARNIIDPEIAALAITGNLEYGEDGMPNNVEKALDALIKNKPYLAPKPPEPVADPPATPAQTAHPNPQNPLLPAMNPPRTGRENIPAPNTTPPGQSLTWGQIYKGP